MRGPIVGLAIYMTVGVSAEEEPMIRFMSGPRLLELCEAEIRTRNICSGYLMGFVDTMVLTENMLDSFGRILGPHAKHPLTLICFPTSWSFKSANSGESGCNGLRTILNNSIGPPRR